MSSPATVNTVETTMKFVHTATGKKAAMVFVTDKGSVGAPSFTDIEDLNDIYNSWMSTAIFGANALQPLVNTAWSLIGSSTRPVLGSGPAWETPTLLPGTRAGEQMPLYSTLCVSQLTSDGGRHFTGRKYPVGPSETDNVAGVPDGAYATALVDAFDELQSVLAGSVPVWEQVVCSRVLAGAPRATPLIDNVVRHRCDLQWDTQRRRGRV